MEKNGNITGGLWLIALGILFLSITFGGVSFSFVQAMFYGWPLLIIGWGVCLIFPQRKMVQMLVFVVQVGLLLALGLFLGSGGTVHQGSTSDWMVQEFTSLELPQTMEEPLSVSLESIFSQVGLLVLSEEQDPVCVVRSDHPGLDYAVDAKEGLLAMEIKPGLSMGMDMRHHLTWELVNVATWQVDLDSVFSVLDADFREASIQSIHSQGAFSVNHIRLGRPAGTLLIDVDSGMSSTVIVLPRGVPVQVEVSKGLSSVRLDGQVLRQGVFESVGYQEAKDRIEIHVDVGLSKVSLVTDKE